VIPAPFDYEVAESADHAVALLGQHGEDAKLLAGGHSLLPLMRLRLAAPSVLVDVGRLRDLDYVRDGGDHVAVGALTTHEELHFDELLLRECPMLAHTAGEIGDPQVRHRGTIGGSVAHADPASDLPTVLLALDAELVVHGPGGDRTVGASDFWKGIFESDLGPQDLLTEIRVPKLAGAGWSYQKFNPRAQDWAVVGVAAVAGRGNGGPGRTAVTLTNMGETPLRASAVEEAVAAGADPASAAERALEGTNAPNDALAGAEYRRHLAKVLTRRALEEAASR
jgi:carbon-monoxide dehydrogenase medium subunit